LFLKESPIWCHAKNRLVLRSIKALLNHEAGITASPLLTLLFNHRDLGWKLPIYFGFQKICNLLTDFRKFLIFDIILCQILGLRDKKSYFNEPFQYLKQYTGSHFRVFLKYRKGWKTLIPIFWANLYIHFCCLN